MDCSTVQGLAKATSTTICIVQPPDWRIYITPALVLISAVIAFLAMRNTRAVARQKATLDLIEKVESTDHYRKLNETFSRLRRGRGFAHLHNPQTEEDKADRTQVNDYLNHYEMVSIGIREDILDENFYRTWMRGPFVRDWNAAVDFVQRERWKKDKESGWTYHPQVFCNYEAVACSWSPEGIRLDRFHSGPPSDEEAGGPGDEPLPIAQSHDGDGARTSSETAKS